MNLDPTDEQLALVDSVRAVCADYFSSEKLHQLANDFSPEIAKEIYEPGWNALLELGLFSLVTAEDKGGVGLGFCEAALVFEELGRNIVPGPVLSTFLCGLLSKDDILNGAIDDIALFDDSRKYEIVASIDSTAISNPDLVDAVLVLDSPSSSLDNASIYYCETSGLKLTSQLPLDPLTPVALAEEKINWKKLADGEAALYLKKVGCVLTAAYQTGLAEGALNLAVDYAKQREQFNTPIGSFQAVKHICADMLTLVEVARAAVYVSAVGLDEECFDSVGSEASKTTADNKSNTSFSAINLDDDLSAAKVMAGKAAEFCGEGCVQVHGGMGYTWEADPHLYLKRAWSISHRYGSAGYHSTSLAETLAN